MSAHDNDHINALIDKIAKSGSFFSNGSSTEIILDALAEIESHHKKEIIDIENSLVCCQSELSCCEINLEEVSGKNSELMRRESTSKCLNGKRIGIIGGHLNAANKLKLSIEDYFDKSSIKIKITACTGPNATTAPINTLESKYSDFDVLAILTDYASHSLTINAEKVAQKHGISLIRSSSMHTNNIICGLINIFDSKK